MNERQTRLEICLREFSKISFILSHLSHSGFKIDDPNTSKPLTNYLQKPLGNC